MSGERRAWSWIHAVAKSDLAPTTRLVCHVLHMHMSPAGDNCYPPTRQIAEETGLSERAVCTHLALARDAGWIEVIRHGYGGQRWAHHEYRPRWPEGWSVGCEAGEGAERGSVPSPAKALNVAPEGTEPDDGKALNDVQCNNSGNISKPAQCARARDPAGPAGAGPAFDPHTQGAVVPEDWIAEARALFDGIDLRLEAVRFVQRVRSKRIASDDWRAEWLRFCSLARGVRLREPVPAGGGAAAAPDPAASWRTKVWKVRTGIRSPGGAPIGDADVARMVARGEVTEAQARGWGWHPPETVGAGAPGTATSGETG